MYASAYGMGSLTLFEVGLLSFKATQYDRHSNKELLILNCGMVKETGDETVLRMVNVKERVSRFYNKKVNPLMWLGVVECSAGQKGCRQSHLKF